MKAAKLILVLALVYVGIVGAFESLLGFSQPAGQGTMVITTFDADGVGHDRVVSRLEHDGQLYAAANHWPRAWYRRATEGPRVEVTFEDRTTRHRAVRPDAEERESVDSAHPLGLVFRILTGFPPRRFVRLEPVTAQAGSQ
jgi:hypothetical protein